MQDLGSDRVAQSQSAVAAPTIEASHWQPEMGESAAGRDLSPAHGLAAAAVDSQGPAGQQVSGALVIDVQRNAPLGMQKTDTEQVHALDGQAIIPPIVETSTPHKHKLGQLPLLPAPPSDIRTGSLLQGSSPPRNDKSQPPTAGPPNSKVPPSTTGKMIFSELYRGPKSTFSKLRNSLPHPVPIVPDPGYDADLVSRDKTKQKEAVKRLLTEKIRTDWDWVWPQPVPDPATVPLSEVLHEISSPQDDITAKSNQPEISPVPTHDEEAVRDPGEMADSESDAGSVYSTVSEDLSHWRPRADWASDLSSEEDPAPSTSPFRFDSPDAVGKVVQLSINSRKARRRRAVREEIMWNDGLACFEARRTAWTGAKTVRVKPKAPSPLSPTSSRRIFWRHHRTESSSSNQAPVAILGASPASPPLSSPLSPVSTRQSHNTETATITPPPSEPESKCSTSSTGGLRRESNEAHALYPVETLLPIPPPLLPPQNPMRASVTPGIYPSLYEKIVTNSMQPSCPVNLSDMVRACVVGWKRDGEWPPRVQVAPSPTAAELAAQKQRKAEQAAKKAAAAAAAAAAPHQRRRSFGFLAGRGDEKDKAKEHNNDEEGSSGGRGIRHSLQKVFSLGHGHSHSGGNPLSPTTTNTAGAGATPQKEVAAGCLGLP